MYEVNNPLTALAPETGETQKEERETMAGSAEAEPSALVEAAESDLLPSAEAVGSPVCSAEEELASLKENLRNEEQRRLEREEFSACFPGVTPEEIPDSVKRSAEEKKIPLAAAYALYLCKRARAKEAAAKACEKAAAETPGLPTGDRGERFYSIEEMRAMSPSEVRRRYGTLLHSLSRGIETIY